MDQEVGVLSPRCSRDAKVATEGVGVMHGEQGLSKSHLPLSIR